MKNRPKHFLQFSNHIVQSLGSLQIDLDIVRIIIRSVCFVVFVSLFASSACAVLSVCVCMLLFISNAHSSILPHTPSTGPLLHSFRNCSTSSLTHSLTLFQSLCLYLRSNQSINQKSIIKLFTKKGAKKEKTRRSKICL